MKRITDALELLTWQHDTVAAQLASAARAAAGLPRHRALDALGEALGLHLDVEHALFYPAIGRLVSPGLREELDAEHHALQVALAELLWLDVDDPWGPAALDTLRGRFARHCAWHEQVLFVAAAECLPAAELVALGEAMHAWPIREPAAAARVRPRSTPAGACELTRS